MSGVFVTFEGTEGSGKSTQIQRLAGRLIGLGLVVRNFREPGGTGIGEEIRHTLQTSPANRSMTPETELLLMNASRAQLVREKVLPALNRGEIVLCDRFYDSTMAYQGYGRQMDIQQVAQIIDFAVDGVQPNRTIYLRIPLRTSEKRRSQRNLETPGLAADRIEEAGRDFFERVNQGYEEISHRDQERIRTIDATQPVDIVEEAVWRAVRDLIPSKC